MTHQKSIMIVSPYFPPKTGGVENYVYNLAKGLSKKYGLRVVVITSNNELKEERVEIKEGIKIYRLPRIIHISNTPINPFWYFKIKRIINDEKPLLINVHSPVPFIADIASLACGKIPLILTYHSGSMKKNNFFPDLIISLYEKYVLPLMYSKSSKIICSSEFVCKTIPKPYAEKTTVISPAVDTTLFHPNEKIIRDRNTILFICRYANMHRMKGFYTILDAIKIISDVKLKVIGEKASVNKENVFFLGVKNIQDLVNELQKATMLILPSQAHVESFGMVLIEGMACKTPVIGTRIGGIPEVIANGKDGFLVSSNSPNELSKAIKTIINNPNLARKMGEEGYKKIHNNFTWENRIDKTYSLFAPYLK